MDLNDFSDGSLWAITPESLDHMLNSLPGLMRAEVVDQAQVKIREQQSYEPELTVQNGVAIIPVSGSISKRAGFLSFLFGGASIDRIRADLDAAMDDRRVKSVVLYIDSPGGRVNGVSELADHIYGLRDKKPIVTFSDGQITSAGTWIGSAANEKIISPTAADGSIGVLTMHVDMSKMDEKAGVKVTYITAGKYKALGNEAEPLSDQAKKMIEQRLNQTYDVFIEKMARFRGAKEETVRSDMAEGRVFIGQQAVDVGLSDRLGSMDDAMARALELAGGTTTGGFAYKMKSKTKEKIMDPKDITSVEQLQEAFPQLAKQLADTAAESARAGVDIETPKTEAVKAETERILGLAKIHFGEEAGEKFASVVAGGVTVDQYKAMADALGTGQQAGDGQGGKQSADEKFRQDMRDGINNAGAPDVGAGGGDGRGPQDFMEAVKTIQAEEKCTRAQAMKKAYAQYPELHKAYIDKVNQKAS